METYIRWSVCVCVIIVIHLVTVSFATSPQLAGVDGKSLFRSLRASNCQEDCSDTKPRPVCGTDGHTYSSRCELKKAKKCDGRRVKVRKKGRCSDSPPGGSSGSKCLEEKAEATAAARQQTSQVFIPNCNKDGTYAEIQCHTNSGYCWCVTKDGKHISATSVKGRRPRCNKKPGRRRKKKKKNRKRKACLQPTRQDFNTRLLNEFKQEYDRIANSDITPTPDPAGDNRIQKEKKIVMWKFEQLDKNNDKRLRFKEIRSFFRMVKKLIKPKACAKTFLKHCDRNGDRHITDSEWTLCLGVGQKASFQLFISLNSGGQSTEAPSTGHKPSDNKNCEDERNSAKLLHQQEPNANIYIPRCQPDGKWTKAQCHRATQYCFCVEEETGIPIPGTSTHIVEPNCTMNEDRAMKGCPFSLKRKFLVDLMNDLTKEMTTDGKDSSVIRQAGDEGLKPREVVARWKLSTLDSNNNGILERKEWKKLRKTNLKNKKYPRKCRRNFLRYCDSDGDQRVTFAEWKDCLGLNRKDNFYNSLPKNGKRRNGKNPFIDQLT